MTPYRSLIDIAAEAHGLDPNLVEAVVMAESSGHTDAFRYEPAFYRRYLSGKPEYDGQIPRRISSSYGLMQVMFTTAKEHGFKDVPEVLFQPEAGLWYGCAHLAKMLKWSKGDVRQALAAYNGGTGNYRATAPQGYAVKVLAFQQTILKDVNA